MVIKSVEAVGKVRTKIVATVGPASRDPETLRRLIEAGVDLFRLNFSHGTHDEHSTTLADIRRVAEAMDRQVGVLQDLGGPKVRLGLIPGDEVFCGLGDIFTVVTDRTAPHDPRQLTCTYRELANDLVPGETVLFADGTVAMVVRETGPGYAAMEVTLPGRLRSRQGVNLPGSKLNVSALTEKDLHDLDWTREHPVEYVGLSFVRQAEDVSWLRGELRARGINARIMAKIEKPQALANLGAILAETDAVMVARGDLGVEVDVARVPAIQKQIIAACHEARVPVVTATQMLASMESSNIPTRAEASDVFNAILDGTDAVMLSGETAVGNYPVEAVATMSRIAAEAEQLLIDINLSDTETMLVEAAWHRIAPKTARPPVVTPITDSIVEAASQTCRRLKAALLVVVTESGRTALAASKHRNATPTLALAQDVTTARAMSLYWGVTAIAAPEITDTRQGLEAVLAWSRARGLIASGDRLVIVRGTTPANRVHNAMLVHEVE